MKPAFDLDEHERIMENFELIWKPRWRQQGNGGASSEPVDLFDPWRRFAGAGISRGNPAADIAALRDRAIGIDRLRARRAGDDRHGCDQWSARSPVCAQDAAQRRLVG